MIAHSARCFGDEATVPVIGTQPVPDLDLTRHFSVMKKTAVTDDRFLAMQDNGKLRWDTGAIPTYNFLDESDSLFAFGVNA